jgi:peptidoglycan/xylan/chitin deacetylase (PgdA/CDA1 family)
VAFGGLVWHAGPALAPLIPPLAARLRIPERLEDRGAAAITFDDGPHPQGTPAALEVLAREGAVATFFLVGEQVRRDPALAAEIAAAGHSVQLHGERHRNQLRLTPAQVREDLRRGAETLASATGAVPRLYRPPFGIFSASGLGAVRASGLEPWLWSRWGHDWRAAATPESIAAEATRDLRGGEVILLHDADHYSDPGCWEATVESMPRIAEAIRQAELRHARL